MADSRPCVSLDRESTRDDETVDGKGSFSAPLVKRAPNLIFHGEDDKTEIAWLIS
jgi:hypothetical protein